MAEHTPGPWYVVPLPWDDSMCIVTSKSPDPHIGEIICRTDEGKWGEHTDEDVIRWQANARLIASAPDPRTALEAAIPIIETYRQLASDMVQYGDSLYGSESGEWLAMIEGLEAILALARAALGAEEAA